MNMEYPATERAKAWVRAMYLPYAPRFYKVRLRENLWQELAEEIVFKSLYEGRGHFDFNRKCGVNVYNVTFFLR
jgi:hypothetical protein